MNLDKLNQWFMLTANLGVLIGIIAVVVELRQTQTAMQGEASTMRAQWAVNIQEAILESRYFELREKIESGENLTAEELAQVRLVLTTQLRHLENMHYQYQIGILDNEIWEANLRGLGDLCERWAFGVVFPEWESGDGLEGLRESFRDLITEPCN